MQIKNKQINELLNQLTELKCYSGFNFSYTLIYNIKLLEKEMEIIKESNELNNDKYIEFEQKRIQLCEQYCDRNEIGEIITNNNQYSITEKKSEFNSLLTTLQTEYKDTLIEWNTKKLEFEQFLELETEINLKTFKQDIIPTDIKAEHLDYIFNLIDD